jgi:outer membrane protein TolC
MMKRMNSITRKRTATTVTAVLLGVSLWGCAQRADDVRFSAGSFEHFQRAATQVEYPDLHGEVTAPPSEAPLNLNTQPREFWDMSLEQAVQMSLQNSPVLRDLGGFVLRSPQTMRTVHGPALSEADPRYGVEAALSEFDTVFAARTSWEKNDRALNNLLLGGGTNFFKQDLGVVQYQLQKRAATGTLFTLRSNTDYDANSAPANLFGSAWNTNFEAEYRQPLLQNAGVDINRIAGPNSTPGQANGVLIARTNTDMAIADFESGIRDLVSNVENAYWDLYFAYRDLDAKVAARNSALDSWRRVQALNQAGRKGGEAEKEAEAREQYFRFEEDVQNALSGRLIDGTQTNNGSSGGSFRPNGGVQVAERRLRLILGLPITDGRMLRPADQPSLARIQFDWPTIQGEALQRRSELRKQHWLIKRRELEYLASKNWLLPSLDTMGRYRWRGFGKDLLNYDNAGGFSNATDNLFDGDFQEWQLGLELNMPLGYRKGYAAVRHAELMLMRERSLLREQERDVQLGLSNALAELERAFSVAQTNYNRRAAAKEHLAAIQAAYEADKATLDLVLDAQRRNAESESRFHAALVEYALAIKNLHYEKGTLLDHNQINMAEGPWPKSAYDDAARRDGSGYPLKPLDYVMRRGPRIDGGTVPQGTAVPPQAPGQPTLQPTPATEVIPPGSAAPPMVTPPPTTPSALPTSSAPVVPSATTAFSPLANPLSSGALTIAPAPLVMPSGTPSIVPQGELLRDNLRPYLQTPAVTPATNEVPLATPTTAIAPANYAWPVTPSVNNTPVISPATTSTPTVAWPPSGSTGLRLER